MPRRRRSLDEIYMMVDLLFFRGLLAQEQCRGLVKHIAYLPASPEADVFKFRPDMVGCGWLSEFSRLVLGEYAIPVPRRLWTVKAILDAWKAAGYAETFPTPTCLLRSGDTERNSIKHAVRVMRTMFREARCGWSCTSHSRGTVLRIEPPEEIRRWREEWALSWKAKLNQGMSTVHRRRKGA